MECDRIREHLEAYALGALEAEERDSVENHLRGCPDCQRLVDEYAEILRALPQALGAVSPLSLPPSVKSRLFGSLEAVSGEASRADTPEGSRKRNVPAHPSERSITPDKKPANVRGRGPIWQWPSRAPLHRVGLLAAVILLVLSLAWSAQLSVALARERALRAEFADLVGEQELVLEVVDSSSTVKVLLQPAESTSPSYGKLYTRPDLPYLVGMAARLAQPPPGQAYQLWLSSKGQIISAGTMAVNSQGFGLIVFEADRNGPVYEAAQLTLQAEGSTAPSGPPVLFWKAPN